MFRLLQGEDLQVLRSSQHFSVLFGEAGFGLIDDDHFVSAPFGGGFRRLRAASFFLDAQKEAKEALRGRLRMGTSCPYSPTPWTPITGGIPWVRQNRSGAQNLSGFLQFNPGHWALGV